MFVDELLLNEEKERKEERSERLSSPRFK